MEPTGLAVEKYRTTAPRLSAWMETAVPEGLTVFLAPHVHRRQLRTTNLLEALNKEIKRRTRVASLFPNENPLLRLVSALLIETDEAWMNERCYMPKETD